MFTILKKNLMLLIACSFLVAASSLPLLAGEASLLTLSERNAPIGYTVSGDGDKTIVFIHGFMDAGNVWEATIRQMNSQIYRFVTLDLPFMGELSELEGEVSLAALAEAVTGVVDDLSGPITLVGQSMGAQIAELVAYSRPDRIKAMAFIAPVPLEGLPVPVEFITTMEALANNEAGQQEFRRQAFPDLEEKELEKIVDNGLKISRANIVALIEAWSNGHPAIGASGPSIPVLIVGGAVDAVCTPEVLESLIAPRFSMKKIVLLPDAGHWPHIDHADEVAEKLEEFLTALGADNIWNK